ncbi:MAG: hypothetical protein FWD53_08460 [Phycisphaerales bacterium]|nr:hypothetical protein [Phycisphaerales bacterium]
MEARASITQDWKITATKPAGGYVPIKADHLLQAWQAYREGTISLFDLRVWLACHELVARRCCMNRKLKACYSIEELCPLIGSTLPRLRAAIRALEKAGLLSWEGDRIGLVPTAHEGELADALRGGREAVQNWQRKVPVPRRVIRFLAGCGRKVMIATVLGHLLRCVYWRDGVCISGGRCKASWIAETFGVDLRNVKSARQELLTSGWLTPAVGLGATSSQTALNRWGLAVVVNLEHSFANDRTSRKSPPPGRLSTAKSPPPCMNKELPSGSQNQQLGQRGCPQAESLVLRQEKKQDREPNLRNVTMTDLTNPRRLDQLFHQAVATGAATNSPSERLRWFAAAERALTLSTQNPCGFFMRLFRQNLWHHITNAQEDAARIKLRQLDNEQTAPRTGATCGSARINFDKSGRVTIQIEPKVTTTFNAPTNSIAA